jgi:hypothetical protein
MVVDAIESHAMQACTTGCTRHHDCGVSLETTRGLLALLSLPSSHFDFVKVWNELHGPIN